MAKFIKITKLLSIGNPSSFYEDRKDEFEYIRPRDVSKIIHHENNNCASRKFVDGKWNETNFKSNCTDIVTYKDSTIRTLMDTDEVIDMINAALEEEEIRYAELYKK